jgi:hypothetical protein
MRNTILILASVTSIFYSCNNNSKSNVIHDFNPGTGIITASFSIDDSAISLDSNSKLLLSNNVETNRLELKGDTVVLPLLTVDTGYNLLFKWRFETLSFKHIPRYALIRQQDMHLEFGIDNPPFDKLLGLIPVKDYAAPKFKQLQYLIWHISEQDPSLMSVNIIE